MNIQQQTGGISIGEWNFDPSEAILMRGSERRRLEHRAGQVLRILARRRGKLVSQQELIDEVWAGRIVSPNSVAITIADIRRALGDNAKTPAFIETVPKRGYRLAAAGDRTAPARPRKWIAYGLGGAAIGAAALALAAVSPGSAPPVITIAAFANETGDRHFDALTESVHELAVSGLGNSERVKVSSNPGGRGLKLNGKLIMWSGHPSVSLSLEDRNRSVVWAGMAAGPEDALPRQMRAAMDDLSTKLEKRR